MISRRAGSFAVREGQSLNRWFIEGVGPPERAHQTANCFSVSTASTM